MMRAASVPVLAAAALVLLGAALPAAARPEKPHHAASRPAAPAGVQALPRDGEAEARLIAVYRLIGQGDSSRALAAAEKLTLDYPNFQLGQLVYGDLLAQRTRPVRMLGDVLDEESRQSPALAALRQESELRLKALRERPPAGSVPSQFARLAPSSRHAIAVDTSRARLYLFENSAAGLRLVADYYLSVGKSGIEKTAEGDMRTPLGVYYITSNLDPRTLKPFYGAGALPINYPNPYDLRRGRTGGGIWLHGTPPDQFARAPLATDGCLVLANPDLRRLLSTVSVRSTPVVISEHLSWVPQQAAHAAARSFEDAFEAWRSAKASGDIERTMAFYTPDFNSYGKPLAEWRAVLQQDMARARGRALQTKDLSYLHWREDGNESMVATFGEVPDGARTGPLRRQYWLRTQGQWKIFFEGNIG
ncbi:L,D-transpeptidase family protein [Xylophilus sp. ASV27]|uniref:L,D-transpeptidase family protein n=1 Tax=Xylophilus sp. ASV27 TaxID=2795129 RepID=UPI00351C2FC0